MLSIFTLARRSGNRCCRQLAASLINDPTTWDDTVQKDRNAMLLDLKIVLNISVGSNPWAGPSWLRRYSNRHRSDANAPSSASVSMEAEQRSWILKSVPKAWIPYIRLSRIEKPTGSWLLAWPCFWSIALATPAGHLPDLKLVALFGTGAVLLRGAGCTINDLWDQDLDRQVHRTRTRPLASRQVTSLQAGGWLLAQLTAGLAILLQLNPYSQVLGASSLLMVASYPLMKRFMNWPQAFLGLTINWGAMLGWAAVQGSMDWSAVAPLYLSGVCWTLVYDTIYAHQDKTDDISVGIKSTALTFGARNKQYLTFFAVLSTSFLGLAGYATDCGLPYYLAMIAPASHLFWQIKTVDLNDSRDCASKFASNTVYGALAFAAIVLGKWQGGI